MTPEFVCDVGTKKGEKIDYAIMKGGEVQILIECKKIGESLHINHASQLFRYFHVTSARISILTNGQVYKFFTDLDAPNKPLTEDQRRDNALVRETHEASLTNYRGSLAEQGLSAPRRSDAPASGRTVSELRRRQLRRDELL